MKSVVFIQILILWGVSFTDSCNSGSRQATPPPPPKLCPTASSILPCICTPTTEPILTCHAAETEEQLKHIFSQDFPTKTFETVSFDGSPDIEKLDMDTNGVSFKRLYIGDLDGIKVISEDFLRSSSSTLEILACFNLLKSTLTTFPFTFIDSLKKLETLRLGGTQIADIPPLQSDSLTTLSLMYFPMNNIEPGTFDGLKKLESLDVSGTNIEVVKSDTIPILGRSQKIDFSHNNINTIEPNAFVLRETPELNSLRINLSSNNLTRIEQDVFEPIMPYIDYLNVNHNPLECGCGLLWILENRTYTFKVFEHLYSMPLCVGGQRITHLNVRDLRNRC